MVVRRIEVRISWNEKFEVSDRGFFISYLSNQTETWTNPSLSLDYVGHHGLRHPLTRRFTKVVDENLRENNRHLKRITHCT